MSICSYVTSRSSKKQSVTPSIFIWELVGKKIFSKIFPVSMVIMEGSEQVVLGDPILKFSIIALFTILHLLIIICYKI